MVKPWRRQESIWENKRRNVSLLYWGQKHKVIQVAWIYASSLKMSFASGIFCCSITPPEGYWRGHMFFFFKCRYSCSVNMTMCHGRLDILRVSPVRHSCRGEACEASGRPAEIRAVVKGNLASASWGQNSCSPSWQLCPVCFFLPPQPFSQPRLEAAYVPVGKEQVSPLLTSLVVVVWSLGCVWLFAMAWTAASQASLSFTISWNLLRFMSIVSVMLSNHLILCHPLLLCPQSFPASGSFLMSWPFASGGQRIGASASVLPVNSSCEPTLSKTREPLQCSCDSGDQVGDLTLQSAGRDSGTNQRI